MNALRTTVYPRVPLTSMVGGRQLLFSLHILVSTSRIFNTLEEVRRECSKRMFEISREKNVRRECSKSRGHRRRPLAFSRDDHPQVWDLQKFRNLQNEDRRGKEVRLARPLTNGASRPIW